MFKVIKIISPLTIFAYETSFDILTWRTFHNEFKVFGERNAAAVAYRAVALAPILANVKI